MAAATKALETLLQRAANWPLEAQNELVQLAQEIEKSLQGDYQATAEELRAIDEGLESVRRGELATDEEVEAVLAKYRSI
jgi:predicted transcriptional regulator